MVSLRLVIFVLRKKKKYRKCHGGFVAQGVCVRELRLVREIYLERESKIVLAQVESIVVLRLCRESYFLQFHQIR